MGPWSLCGSITLSMRLGLKDSSQANIITPTSEYNPRNNGVLRQSSFRVKTVCASLQCGVCPLRFQGNLLPLRDFYLVISSFQNLTSDLALHWMAFIPNTPDLSLSEISGNEKERKRKGEKRTNHLEDQITSGQRKGRKGNINDNNSVIFFIPFLQKMT